MILSKRKKSIVKWCHHPLVISIFSSFTYKAGLKKVKGKKKVSSDHLKYVWIRKIKINVYTRSSWTKYKDKYKYYSSDSIVGLWMQLSIWWSSNILFSGLQRPVGKHHPYHHSEKRFCFDLHFTIHVYMSDQKSLNADWTIYAYTIMNKITPQKTSSYFIIKS